MRPMGFTYDIEYDMKKQNYSLSIYFLISAGKRVISGELSLTLGQGRVALLYDWLLVLNLWNINQSFLTSFLDLKLEILRNLVD